MTTGNQQHWFPFLSLPREIRDLIYTSLLTSETPLPSSPESLSKTTTIFPFWQLDTRFIHIPPHVSPNIEGLLVSNSQIRTELLAKLEKPGPRHSLRYRLDCMVVKDSELFPSWRCNPAPVQYMYDHVFQLDVRSVGGGSAEIKATGAGRWMTSAFKVLELIEEFFNRGPTFRRMSEIREDVRVRTVLVKVIKPDDLPGEDPREKPRRRRTTKLPDGSLHPMAMYEQLVGYVAIFKRTLQGRAQELKICYDTHCSVHMIEKR